MINFTKKVLNYIKIKLIKLFVLKSKISYKKKFNFIYNTNYWSSKESRSGTGSTLDNTQIVRKGLNLVIKSYNIKNILDIPCGDFSWMMHFLEQQKNLNYVGGDIVSNLIRDLSEKYTTKNISFRQIDLIKDDLPKADLLFCRDCFMHLSNEDIKMSLKNFLRSDIKYLMASNNINESLKSNINIQTGEYRKVNLFLPPFNLPKKNLLNIDDIMVSKSNIYQDERVMSLWSKDQLLNKIQI